MYNSLDVTAVILAGGQARRMGGKNKALMPFQQQTLIEHVLERISPQTSAQIISANQDLDMFNKFNRPVISDDDEQYQGPLSGIISCQHAVRTPLLITLPCDTPYLPDNLLQKLLDDYNQHKPDICVVHDGQRMQNLIMLFHVSLTDSLREFFNQHNRKVADWITQCNYRCVDFSAQKNQFFNINTPEELRFYQSDLPS